MLSVKPIGSENKTSAESTVKKKKSKILIILRASTIIYSLPSLKPSDIFLLSLTVSGRPIYTFPGKRIQNPRCCQYLDVCEIQLLPTKLDYEKQKRILCFLSNTIGSETKNHARRAPKKIKDSDLSAAAKYSFIPIPYPYLPLSFLKTLEDYFFQTCFGIQYHIEERLLYLFQKRNPRNCKILFIFISRWFFMENSNPPPSLLSQPIPSQI